MEDQMTTPTSYLHVPARSRGISVVLRIAILVLDFAAIIAVSVSLGLYHKWTPGTSYPTTALKPTYRTDWTDSIVLVAILVSFLRTGFITIRSAWTSKALHLGFYVAFEFISVVWLLACSIPALMLRESGFKNLVAISNTCDMGTVTLMNGDKVPWVCMPHLETLKRLQIASYSIACAIAVLHFSLFSLAFYSTKQHPQEDAAQTALSQPIENAPSDEKFAHKDRASTTTAESDSDSSSPQPRSPARVAEI